MSDTSRSGNAKESVKVVVRCRPPSTKEVADERKTIATMDLIAGSVTLTNPNKDKQPRMFTFDSVYDQFATQKLVYDEVAFPLVESVLEGFNGTIFAYGQTGSGKTWTMNGKTSKQAETDANAEDTSDFGIIPNSFEHIFNEIKLGRSNPEADSEDVCECEYLVRASYLEIYNEEIRDLLSEDPKKRLDLKESPDTGVFVKDLKYEVVENREQCMALLRQGNKNRSTGETQMNIESSRSHAIFSIVVEMNETHASGESHYKVGKLNLVDLAGSERQSKTGAAGERLKEGCKINLSLSALGNVISALVDGGLRHVPYRDSKLTRLLRDSLGGNTKTVMIGTISPVDDNHDETMSTLRYANRAKNIKNTPVINEDPKDTLLREYKDEITRLKNMLEAQAVASEEPTVAASDHDELLRKLEVLERQVKSQAENASEMEEAKKEREERIAHVLLKEQQRKELELQRVTEVAEQEKRLIEEECKNAHTVAETQEKVHEAMKVAMNNKIEKMKSEMRDMQIEFQDERESLLETIREQAKELKRYDQIVDLFLPFKERAKLVEKSVWNDNDAEWRLPKLQPRQGIVPVEYAEMGEPVGGLEVCEPQAPRRKNSIVRQRSSQRVDTVEISPQNLTTADGEETKAVESAVSHTQALVGRPKSRHARARRSNSRDRKELNAKMAKVSAIYGQTQTTERPVPRATNNSSNSGNTSPAPSAGTTTSGDASGTIWSVFQDEEKKGKPAYGDRCQSRQGRRASNTHENGTLPPI